jgi:DNA modification methylase
VHGLHGHAPARRALETPREAGALVSLRADVLRGDCRVVLAALPAASVHCVVTSPPYWGLRDYGFPGQIGLEATPEEYVDTLVDVFRAVRRVLRDDGTLWVNLGDSYANNGNPNPTMHHSTLKMKPGGKGCHMPQPVKEIPLGLKPKDLVGMPWRVAFALQADGWYLRADIIWAKPNPMPESVTDRPTKAHEYVFLLTKSGRYYYDAEAVREAAEYGRRDWGGTDQHAAYMRSRSNLAARGDRQTPNGGYPKGKDPSSGRNLRSVWTIATQAYAGAHFATFPQALVVPCVKAGTSEKGCCAGCGAPWERVVARTPAALVGAERIRNIGGRTDGYTQLPAGGVHGGTATTTGWRPTCSDAPTIPLVGDIVPCTVLDPFAGSGTVVLVANKLGRHAIGIEANPTYGALSTQRNVQLVLL